VRDDALVADANHDRWVQRLTTAARSGEILNLTQRVSDPDLLDPAQADTWPENRRVPAAAIRTTLLNAKLNPDPHGLRLRGAHIIGALDLEHVRVPCPLWLTHCRIEESADLTKGRLVELNLAHTYSRNLVLDGAQITGGTVLTGLKATGEVRALGAHLGGQLNLTNAELTNENGTALNLDRAQITGEAVLTGLKATGEVRALGAHLGGQLNLTNAELTNENGPALNLDRAQITGSAFLTGLKATGEVRALSAHIGGQLSLVEAELTNENGPALDLDRAQITGSAFLTGLKATGEVRALGAHLGGQLILVEAELTNENGTALDLEGAQIGQLFLRNVAAIKGALDLTAAEIGALVVDEEMQGEPRLPGASLAAAGWRLRDVHGALLTDWKVAERWLDSRPPETGFTAQPWHELAAVYDKHARPAEAQRLRFEAARRTTKHAKGWAKPPRVLYGLLVGHGYYPTRTAAFWLLTAFVVSWALIVGQQGSFVPTDFSAATAAVTAHTRDGSTPDPHPVITGDISCARMTPNYQCLNAPLYALSTVLPTPGAFQTSAWAPATGWLAFLLAALKAFGWLMTVLLLAGLTGLLRKT